MASFALADVLKSDITLPKTELPDDETSALEFPGGIAYDHEALPKLVAVHTLIEVNPGQTNAQDIRVTEKDIKKKRLPRLLPRPNNTIPRSGSRRWIIRSKPEFPFSQLTSAPKTSEEIPQPQSLPSPSYHDEASPKKTLFNVCNIKNAYTAYCHEDLDKGSQDEVNENESQGPLSPLLSYTSKDTSSKIMISKKLCENEIEEEAATTQTEQGQSNETTKENKEASKPSEIIETSNSFKRHYWNPMGDFQKAVLNSKQGDSELKTTSSDADCDLSVMSLEHPIQTVATAREDENNEQEIMGLLHATPFVPSQDSTFRSTERKEHMTKSAETAIQFCSDPNFTSDESTKTMGKAGERAMIQEASLKKLKDQVRAVSKNNLAPSSMNLKQEISASKKTVLQNHDKTPLSTDSKHSHRKRSANQSSSSMPSLKKSDASRNGKLSLRDRVLKRIKRIKDTMKPYEETPEATRLYSKLAKYRKLGFGVASSLSELSKNGEIDQVAEDGQVKKNELSEELLEELVLMNTLRRDTKPHRTKFSTEQKELHFKLKEKITSKNSMKVHEELKNKLNEVSGTKGCYPAPAAESSFVRAEEDDGHYIHAFGINHVEENEKQEDPEVKDHDDLSGEKTLNEEHCKVDDVQTLIPERKKSLNQCLDKLRTITASSLKRPNLDSEKDNSVCANNQDPGCTGKRPRKAAPRRLSKGRRPSYSDDDSISPDSSLNDLPQDIDLTWSEVQDHFSFSNLSSDAQGKTSEASDEAICDMRISTGKCGSITKEENLIMENMNNDSNVEVSGHRDTIALPNHSVSESVTVTCDKTTPLKTCLFTKDTLKQQMEKATWEPSWYDDEDNTSVYTQSWVGVPYTTTPQENYTIKTSLDREERIKALLAKQNQLLSKIDNNFSGNSS